jgi:hypothetical protein
MPLCKQDSKADQTIDILRALFNGSNIVGIK